jgi:hypothetical protein
MTISLKHAFTSAKTDGTDSTLIQPSNWNAEHTITLAAGKIIGRDTSGAGAAQELPLAFDTSGNAAMSATGYFTPAVGTGVQRPGTPTTGMFRFNTTSGKFEGYNGTIWGSIGGGGTISDTAPSSPSAGDLWWNSANGQLYIYYTDANSSQWVIANAFTGATGVYLPLTGGTVSGDISMSGTGQIKVPSGTTAQRSGSPTTGMLRFNSTINKFEGYQGSAWGFLGGAAGAGGDDIFYENGKTVTTSYSITSGKNAMSVGPITVNTGITVTVPTGSRWVVL